MKSTLCILSRVIENLSNTIMTSNRVVVPGVPMTVTIPSTNCLYQPSIEKRCNDVIAPMWSTDCRAVAWHIVYDLTWLTDTSNYY